MNWLVALIITWGIVMIGVCYSESVKDTAKYQCIQEVAKTQSVDNAKELCK